jgi:hypothetical protein
MSKFNLVLVVAVSTFAASNTRAIADSLTEDFSADPLTHGWQQFGNTNLFHWNPANHNLEVTWDSSQTNSYFYRPIGTILAIDDDFSLSFDLTLSNAQATGFFELAVGLFHLSDATNAAFSRANAAAPNLFEFDYYPDGGFGPSIDATLSDDLVNATNTADFYFAYDNLPLVPGTTYHVALNHQAGQPTVSGLISTNGVLYTSLPNSFPGPITDFRIDTLSVSSYTANDDPYGDSILAGGTIDNIVATFPPSPIQNLTGAISNSVWLAQFDCRSNWLYTLQASSDVVSWADVTAATPGIGSHMILQDTNAVSDKRFYRVRANRP